MQRLSLAAIAFVLAVPACSAPHPGAQSALPVAPASSVREVRDVIGGGPPMSMRVSMYDAPLPTHGDAHVNIAIVGLDVVAKDVAHEIVAYDTARVVDLLTLQKTPLPLVGDVPSGSYDTLRLLVDPAQSNVTVDGRVYPIRFQHVGLHGKWNSANVIALDTHLDISGSGGDTVAVAVDFNVLQSITLRGNYAYANPKLVSASGPSSVQGTVQNAAGAPVVSATVVAIGNDGKVVNSTLTASDGSFMLHALHAGAYTIEVRNTSITDNGDVVLSSGATSVAGPSRRIDLAHGDLLDLGTLVD